jgi:peptidoglycan/xylan/chitin deacetylase (PgdA/CDA1 family)
MSPGVLRSRARAGGQILSLLVLLIAAGLLLSGCATISRPSPRASAAEASALASEAAEDPAGAVSVEPTAGLTSEASRTPWPADAAALRAKVGRVEFMHATTKRKIVALTFDDGPFENSMVRATYILTQAGAKATFFCVGGRVLHNVAETRFAWSQGMEIENHTWSHRELTRTSASDLVQILAADAMISDETGSRPLWVRPKSGAADATGTAVVFDSGHLLAGWNVHAGDTGTWTSQQITQHVLDQVKPGDVVDLHVTNPRTLDALPAILDGLNARGYRMVTLSELALASR